MDILDIIETPENVELERRLAGIGSRFLAGLLDNLILGGILIALVLLVLVLGLALTPLDNEGALFAALVILVSFIISWGYFVYFEYRTNGQTPGKKAMRVRVVKEGGTPMTFTDVAIRSVLRVVDAIPGFFYLVGGITMFVTKKCQRLGDLAAGTVVISEQLSDYSARTDKRVSAQWEGQAGAAALQATGLTPEEYRVLNSYWMRRGQLTIEARHQVLPQLLYPILRRTGQTLADGRIETLEAYVDLMMRQARYAEAQVRTTYAGRDGER